MNKNQDSDIDNLIEAKSSTDDMIPKADIDEYIKQQVAIMYKDGVESKKMEIEARRQLEDEAKANFVNIMLESPEPWIEMVSYREDSDGRIKTEVNWNDAFITRLREEKYEGITEDELIQKYLLLVMANTTEAMDT